MNEVPVPSVSTAVQARPASRRTRSLGAWLRLLVGVCILAVVVWRVGTGAFLVGVRMVDGSALATAFAIGAVTTMCCAWRWRRVAAGLGHRLALPGAIAAYYRSQFLNTTLPGGVVGDVHRAMRHGRNIGDVGLGVRAVVLERLAGQAVQAVIAVCVLLALPSPVRSHLPAATGAIVAAVLGAVLAARALARGRSRRWAKAMRTVGTEIRDGLFARRNWMGVALASTVVVVGQMGTFLLAARTAGSTAPMALLLPLALLALLAMGLPVNVAGWGPREGVAAWAFGAAGLNAAQGVATAVTYGVLVLVASLPGAAVLVVQWISRVPVVNSSPDRHRDHGPTPVPALGHGDARG